MAIDVSGLTTSLWTALDARDLWVLT